MPSTRAPCGEAGSDAVTWTIGADVIRRQEVRDADRDFSRASWTPGGSFSGTTESRASGNTLNFTIGGPGGSESGRYGILGECSEDVYTGPLTLPGPLGEVCGFAYADSKWLDGFGRRERGAVYLAAGHPLGGGADVHVDARAAQGESDFRYAPAVGDFAYTLPDDVEARLAREHGTTTADIRDNAVLLHRFVVTAIATGRTGSRNTTSPSASGAGSETAWATTRCSGSTGTTPSRRAVPS